MSHLLAGAIYTDQNVLVNHSLFLSLLSLWTSGAPEMDSTA